MRCGAIALLGCGLLACSESDGASSSQGTQGSGNNGGLVVDDAGTGGAGAADGAYSDVEPGPNRSDSFGKLLIVDSPDSECGDAASTGAAFTGADPAGPPYTRTGAVAERHWAQSTSWGTLVTFDPDGAAVAGPVDGASVAASAAGEIVALDLQFQRIVLRRFDAMLAPSGDDVEVATGDYFGPSVAATADRAAVTWCSAGGAVHASVFAASGSSLGTLDFGEGTSGAEGCTTAVAWNGSDFIVVWSRHRADTLWEASWSRVDPSGAASASAATSLFVSTERHFLVGLSASPTGSVALFDETSPLRSAVVVRIDAEGAPVVPAYRLAGTSSGLDVAGQGTSFGVVAARNDGRTALRAFDALAVPLGPWVCHSDLDPSSNLSAVGGLSADGAGWGVVARQTDGRHLFRRTDLVGSGL